MCHIILAVLMGSETDDHFINIQIVFRTSLYSQDFIALVPQMLTMMVDLEEDEDWANADELEDDDFDR